MSRDSSRNLMLHNIDEQRQIAAVRPKSFLISVRKVLTRENHFCSNGHYPIGGRGGGLYKLFCTLFGQLNFPKTDLHEHELVKANIFAINTPNYIIYDI